MMASLQSEISQLSLFSLELVVDKLYLENVTCRFPAVAFRLLDFPTIIIYHVEHDLAKTIKRKLSLQPNYNVPPRIHELMNKDGAYEMKKGKSCLFKLSTETLFTHLTNTPLYVMIIDSYPEVAKLLGSCTVPLDNAMVQVRKDIENQGLSMPSVHGNKGYYKVYNLMGVEIGHVTLGYRLLSLGQGLMQHIPDHAITKRTSEIMGSKDSNTSIVSPKHGKVIVHNLDTADENVQVTISEPAVEKKYVSIGVETDTPKSKKKNKPKVKSNELRIDIEDEVDGLFVSNTVCPPPLFYNSEAEPQIFHSAVASNPILSSHNLQVEDYESDSSCDTIREVDTMSDTMDYRYVDETVSYEKAKVSGKSRSTTVKETVFEGQKLEQLPILNALLGEILSLQNPNIPKDVIKKQLAGPKRSRSASPVSPRAPVHLSPRISNTPKEQREEFLARMSSPKHRTHSPDGRCGHKKCNIEAENVPKTKSWLRKEPALAVKKVKNKLTYGMTNTQRLRLAQGNPELLKELEQKEEQRKQQKKVFKQTQNISKSNKQTVPPEKDARKLQTGPSKQTKTAWNATMHKKPVPTPRHSIKGESIDLLLEKSETEAVNDGQVLKTLDAPMGIVRESTFYEDEESVTGKSKTSSHIEVHVPGGRNKNDISLSATDDELDQFENEQIGKQMNRTTTLAVPGLPLNDLKSSYESKTSGVSGYSDDFENAEEQSNKGHEPMFLKRVVDRYSDSEPDTTSYRSYHSAVSKSSKSSYASAESNQKSVGSSKPPGFNLSNMVPITSSKSPEVHQLNTQDSLPTREPMVPSSTSDTATIQETKKSPKKSPRKAKLERSVSVESENGYRGPVGRRMPRPSPRQRDRSFSIRTESVSSYVPSDEEYPEKDNGHYSDEFETLDEESSGSIETDILANIQPVNKLNVGSSAKLGYTWAN